MTRNEFVTAITALGDYLMQTGDTANLSMAAVLKKLNTDTGGDTTDDRGIIDKSLGAVTKTVGGQAEASDANSAYTPQSTVHQMRLSEPDL